MLMPSKKAERGARSQSRIADIIHCGCPFKGWGIGSGVGHWRDGKCCRQEKGRPENPQSV